MTLHTHGHDDCALTSEITIGDFDGGHRFTTVYLGGGEVKARAWAHWGQRLIRGCLVDAIAGARFNAYHLHEPMRSCGERYAIVCYRSASWARLTPAVRQELLEIELNCTDDM